jgi:hypothetical protein
MGCLMTRFQSLAVALVIIGAGGACPACSKATPPEPEKPEPAAAPVASPAPAPMRSAVTSACATTTATGPDDIAWDTPPAWTTLPNPNTMRKATYKVPKAGGDAEDGEVTVSSAGGGVDANIKRWASQFGNASPKTEPRKPNGLSVTVVEMKGTYAASSGMMGGPSTPKEKFMLLGAVVDAGDRQHFVKLTGPEKTVLAAKKDFDALVASLRAK